MALRRGFTAPDFPHARTFDGARTFDELPGHTAYHFPELGVLFTGDALVAHDGTTDHRGPGTVSRAFIHDSGAALTSLDRLDAFPDALLLPGHGDPFPHGVRAATAAARATGRT